MKKLRVVAEWPQNASYLHLDMCNGSGAHMGYGPSINKTRKLGRCPSCHKKMKLKHKYVGGRCSCHPYSNCWRDMAVLALIPEHPESF